MLLLQAGGVRLRVYGADDGEVSRDSPLLSSSLSIGPQFPHQRRQTRRV